MDREVVEKALTQGCLDRLEILKTHAPQIINILEAQAEKNEGKEASIKIAGTITLAISKDGRGVDVKATGSFGFSESFKTQTKHIDDGSQPGLPFDGTCEETPDSGVVATEDTDSNEIGD